MIATTFLLGFFFLEDIFGSSTELVFLKDYLDVESRNVKATNAKEGHFSKEKDCR